MQFVDIQTSAIIQRYECFFQECNLTVLNTDETGTCTVPGASVMFHSELIGDGVAEQ